ncbi:MAG: hypothetical protein FJ279_21800 [Planctomycetes bacterium]|nr:hypothetical protein [Planctomycetota bacterium]
MTREVTLELPDEVVSRAERLASLARRRVKEVLADAVSAVLPPLDVVLGERRPVEEMSDDEVLRLTNLRLKPAQDQGLSLLLDKQQAGALGESERAELLALMQVYEANLLRQAEALAEAVRRRLREPLSP